MISKKYNRKKIVRLIHNLIFVILFVWLDLKIVEFFYRSITSVEIKSDIFDGDGAAFSYIFGLCLFTPFFVSELLYLFGSNMLLKNKLKGFTKCCAILSTVFSALIIVGYLLFRFVTIAHIPKVLPRDLLLLLGWIGMFISSALYLVCLGNN